MAPGVGYCWLCENSGLCPVHDADEYCKRGHHNWESGGLISDWICTECGTRRDMEDDPA